MKLIYYISYELKKHDKRTGRNKWRPLTFWSKKTLLNNEFQCSWKRGTFLYTVKVRGTSIF